MVNFTVIIKEQVVIYLLYDIIIRKYNTTGYIYHSSGDGARSPNACSFLCLDIRSNSTTPRRVALARMFKEAGLRSPRTKLTQVQIEIIVCEGDVQKLDTYIIYKVGPDIWVLQ